MTTLVIEQAFAAGFAFFCLFTAGFNSASGLKRCPSPSGLRPQASGPRPQASGPGPRPTVFVLPAAEKTAFRLQNQAKGPSSSSKTGSKSLRL